jgi:hypothetical protein
MLPCRINRVNIEIIPCFIMVGVSAIRAIDCIKKRVENTVSALRELSAVRLVECYLLRINDSCGMVSGLKLIILTNKNTHDKQLGYQDLIQDLQRTGRRVLFPHQQTPVWEWYRSVYYFEECQQNHNEKEGRHNEFLTASKFEKIGLSLAEHSPHQTQKCPVCFLDSKAFRP